MERALKMTISEIYTTIIVTVIIVWIAVIIKYNQENKIYKKTVYGKQKQIPFWKILMNKGARGEYRTSQQLEKAKFEHKLLFNCYIPNRNGEKTELDIIMISTKGIFVIENKNYSGWIFGDENSKNWCETLKGKKYFFYNPIKQNRSHIKNLEKMLCIGEDKYISLITFNTDANLKKIKVESANTYVMQYKALGNFINAQTLLEDRMTHAEIEEVYNKLLPGTQLSEEEKKEHIRRIKKQFK